MPGAWLQADGTCLFRVWAPFVESCLFVDEQSVRTVAMKRDEEGFWETSLAGVRHGFRYRYRLDGKKDRPDPASQWQPEGVHGCSAVVDHSLFTWTDNSWSGIPPSKMVIGELHTGTYTPEGSFDGIIQRLDHFVAAGINTIEVMPVAHFPGVRNWGYDGVYPFAVHTAYGGAEGFKRLVDACHARDIAVLLDVVYNHLGPEGNYLRDFGPYFTEHKYRTPWGAAVNFDDQYSDHVRAYFIANALFWLEFFHLDGLRLDAVHAIYDFSARHFLEEMADATGAFGAASGRRRLLIAESDLNDPRIIAKTAAGGMGIDAQWSDDLHHALHAALTGERAGYYRDFGSLRHVADALQYGYSYRGAYSLFRKRRFGRTPKDIDAEAFVVCSQNHDQVGNRAFGERLITLAGPDGARLAAAAVLLSPMVPLLFMGEEWGEEAPFLYFVDHGDSNLCSAVREGRKKEFSEFLGDREVPDPTDAGTFERSRPDWSGLSSEKGRSFLGFYRLLTTLRREHPVLSEGTFAGSSVEGPAGTSGLLVWSRENTAGRVRIYLNFADVPATAGLPGGTPWRLVFDSCDRKWGGGGAMSDGEAPLRPRSCRMYDALAVYPGGEEEI